MLQFSPLKKNTFLLAYPLFSLLFGSFNFFSAALTVTKLLICRIIDLCGSVANTLPWYVYIDLISSTASFTAGRVYKPKLVYTTALRAWSSLHKVRSSTILLDQQFLNPIVHRLIVNDVTCFRSFTRLNQFNRLVRGKYSRIQCRQNNLVYY